MRFFIFQQMVKTKVDYRTIYKQKRLQLNDLQVEEKSIAIANQTLNVPIWDKTFFHLFLSIVSQKEVNTDLLLHVLQGKDKQVVISQSDFKSYTLKHFLLTDSTPIKTNAFGIPEPQDGLEVPVDKIDVVFIPLLAFDQNGNRIGFGKGFYDRFLSECRKDTIKIGLSFFEATPTLIITDEHDVRLDYVITPEEVYEF